MTATTIAVAQQSDNPLAVAASLALIMGAVYVLGALSAHRLACSTSASWSRRPESSRHSSSQGRIPAWPLLLVLSLM